MLMQHCGIFQFFFLISFQLILSWQGEVWEENCRTSGSLWGRGAAVAWHPLSWTPPAVSQGGLTQGQVVGDGQKCGWRSRWWRLHIVHEFNFIQEGKEGTAKEVCSKNGLTQGHWGGSDWEPSGLWKVSVWVLRELKVFQSIQWECCASWWFQTKLSFMLGPGTCPWPGGPFPRCLAESVPDCWWPQSFWAVMGDQILSPSLHQEGTPCRVSQLQGWVSWTLWAAASWEQRQGWGPRGFPLPPVTGDVMAPWDPWSLGRQWTFGQQVTGRRAPGRTRKRGGWPRWPESVYLPHKLPGVAGAGQQHGSRDAFSGLALAACIKPISNMAACLIQHSGQCSQRSRPSPGGHLFKGVFYYMCCF